MFRVVILVLNILYRCLFLVGGVVIENLGWLLCDVLVVSVNWLMIRVVLLVFLRVWFIFLFLFLKICSLDNLVVSCVGLVLLLFCIV